MSTKSTSKPKSEEVYPDALFLKNERVFCFHGAMMYEGKILLVEKLDEKTDEGDSYQYLIHYAGWSKKWDERVPESRVLKYNEENIAIQKKQNEEQKKGGVAGKKRGKGGAGKGGPGSKRLATADSVLASTPTGSGPTTPTHGRYDPFHFFTPLSNVDASDKSSSLLDLDTTPESKEPSSHAESRPESPVQDNEGPSDGTSIAAPELTLYGDSERLSITTKDKKAESEQGQEGEPAPAASTPKETEDDFYADREVAGVDWDATFLVNNSDHDQENSAEPVRTKTLSQRLNYEAKIPVTRLDEMEFEDLVPEKLQRLLVRDYCGINLQKLLSIAPCRYSVNRILDEYLKTVNQLPIIKRIHCQEFIRGLKVNFSREMAEGTSLVYQPEYDQYRVLLEHMHREVTASADVEALILEVFGLRHLLRFCCKFASYVNNRRGEEELQENLLKECLVHLYSFLDEKADKFYEDVEEDPNDLKFRYFLHEQNMAKSKASLGLPP